MIQATSSARALGRTGLTVPPIIFGTSCLGNLYHVVPDATKTAIVSEILQHSPIPAVFDSAGKYGAGLALETLGKCLRTLSRPASDILISNKLGWYRIPLSGPEPSFEPGVWAGLHYDAELRISYDGILACYQQGREHLGQSYPTHLVSIHDPDEYLSAATDPHDRARRFQTVVDAYRALFELKSQGVVKAVGVGAKDWRVIREIAAVVDLDWVMFACSLTVYSHPGALLTFIADLHARGVGMFNSAVFNAGFLTGGEWFDYRRVDPVSDSSLFIWRRQFFHLCGRHNVSPADACVQFGLAVPGIVAVALNSEKPSRVKANVATIQVEIPPAFWRGLKDDRLIAADFPVDS